MFFLPDVGRVRRMPSRAVADWFRVCSSLALKPWCLHAKPRGQVKGDRAKNHLNSAKPPT